MGITLNIIFRVSLDFMLLECGPVCRFSGREQNQKIWSRFAVWFHGCEGWSSGIHRLHVWSHTLVGSIYNSIWSKLLQHRHLVTTALIISHPPFHQKVWYYQGVTIFIISHLAILDRMWWYKKRKAQKIQTKFNFFNN